MPRPGGYINLDDEWQSVQQFADKLGVSVRRVRKLFEEGRIPGAEKRGGVIYIPVGAEDPRRPRGARGHLEKRR